MVQYFQWIWFDPEGKYLWYQNMAYCDWLDESFAVFTP